MSDARIDGRRPDELRPVDFTTDFQRYPEGSVLIKTGHTWVLCAASVEDGVPSFVGEEEGGWITAEYAMLPRSTHTRSGRHGGGRAKEIQRLIGRSLRTAVNRKALGSRTITIDCDVLQADGGTRVASITGAFAAISLAVQKLAASGAIASVESVLPEPVAAISVGIVKGEPRLDLCYEEDSTAETDMNVVMTASGNVIEVQGTAERAAFSRKELDALLDLAHKGIAELCEKQKTAVAR